MPIGFVLNTHVPTGNTLVDETNGNHPNCEKDGPRIGFSARRYYLQ
jgi:hypothetical protein